LGNEKSKVLLRVELELWRALLNVATGRDTIFPAMRTFYANLDRDELEGVEIEDRAFFSTSMSLYAHA
jgi:hypothetical protein